MDNLDIIRGKKLYVIVEKPVKKITIPLDGQSVRFEVAEIIPCGEKFIAILHSPIHEAWWFAKNNVRLSPWVASRSLEQVIKDIQEEIEEVKKAEGDEILEEVGDLLMDTMLLVIKVAKHYGLEPEEIVERMVEKFSCRKPHVLENRRVSLDEEMSTWWERKTKEVVEKIAERIEEKVKLAVENKEVAILFSGGVDSSTLATLSKKYAKSTTLYTITWGESEDIKYAKVIAQKLSLPLRVIEVAEKELIETFRKMRGMFPNQSFVKVEVLAPIYLLMKHVREPIVLTGAGAEEVFMGYDRHYAFPEEELKEKLREEFSSLQKNEIAGINSIAKLFGKEAKHPYNDLRLLEMVHSLPPKIIAKDKERKKYLLREAAKLLLVPEEAINRKKKALQYSSRIHKVILKAKRKGLIS